jgi:hypothetical protein
MSDGRTDTFSQTDLQVQHEIRLSGNKRLSLTFNVLNLFDQEAGTSKFSTYQAVNGVNPDEAAFYNGTETLANDIKSQNVVVDPRFLLNNAFQLPFQARFGVRFGF